MGGGVGGGGVGNTVTAGALKTAFSYFMCNFNTYYKLNALINVFASVCVCICVLLYLTFSLSIFYLCLSFNSLTSLCFALSLSLSVCLSHVAKH